QLITDGVVNFGGNSMVAGNPIAGGNLIGGNPKKKAERDKNKRIKKSDPVTVPNSLPAQSLETSFQGVGTEGIHKKRNDMESNGVFHENEPRPRPNKMAQHISNLSPENGRRINFAKSLSSSL
nr:hypothetical protein [Tanacetum cinerariifolium]